MLELIERIDSNGGCLGLIDLLVIKILAEELSFGVDDESTADGKVGIVGNEITL